MLIRYSFIIYYLLPSFIMMLSAYLWSFYAFFSIKIILLTIKLLEITKYINNEVGKKVKVIWSSLSNIETFRSSMIFFLAKLFDRKYCLLNLRFLILLHYCIFVLLHVERLKWFIIRFFVRVFECLWLFWSSNFT